MTKTFAERGSVLPRSLPPRGLRREEAAAYIGASPALFDEMVRDGRMPKPKRIGGTNAIWDVRQLDVAFEALDQDNEHEVGGGRNLPSARGAAAFTPATAEKPPPHEEQSTKRRRAATTSMAPAISTIEHGGIIEYLTEGELAERWGISVQKLRKDRLTGKGIAFAKFGRAVRYAVKTVLKYEASVQRTNTAAGHAPAKIQRP